MGCRRQDHPGYRTSDGYLEAMVEKHLRLAREALRVETTAQAVAKAS